MGENWYKLKNTFILARWRYSLEQPLYSMEYLLVWYLTNKIPTLFFKIPEILIDSGRVFARPLQKIRKTQTGTELQENDISC